MLERLSPHRRNLALAGLGLLLAWFAWTVRAVLNPLILGYLLAYILNPLVQRLERRGWGRRAAANLIFLAFFLVAGGVATGVFFQGRALVNEVATSDPAQQVREKLPEFLAHWLELDEAADEGGQDDGAPRDEGGAEQGGAEEPAGAADPGAPPQGAEPAEDEGLRATMAEVARDVWLQIQTEQGMRRAALQGAGEAWPYLRAFFGSVIALVTLVFLLPIYAYFLLFELDRIHGFVLRYVPRREKGRFARVGTQVGEVLANFFRGRLVVCFLKGALITAGLAAGGVKYALLLGMLSGFLALVPFVGPLVGFVFATLVALTTPDFAWSGALLRTALPFAVAELAEGYVFLPKILGDSLGLHPVVILVSVFAGGAALGMFGFLIAVPLVAALVIMVREMVLPALAAFADEDGEEGAKGAAKKKGGAKKKG